MQALTNICTSVAKRLTLLIGALTFSVASFGATVDLPIYVDSLSSGWSNWSWDTNTNQSNRSPTHTGAGSIAVTVTAAWGALYLHADSPVNTSGYNQLQFWVHGGTGGGQHLQLVVNSVNYAFTPVANAWTQVSVPLSAIGYPATLADLYWQDASGSVQPTFYIDDITLLAGPGGTQLPVPGPALTIDVGSGRHAISSDVYGINLLSDEQLAKDLKLPVRRWGGNSTTRYNWQNDTTNTAGDWYFENIPNDNPNPATLPDGSAADRFVEQNSRTGTRSLITVPTVGWVAKRRTIGHPYDCAFSVKKYGAQQATDPWDPDCGNGKTTGGDNITGNDPTDTSATSAPSFITGWINHLVGKYGRAASGGVAYYAFDNEPMIWHSTHRDIHPLAPTYDEIRDRTFMYGAAIKAADPSAKTLGPVEDGWCRYLYSAADNCGPGGDYQAHGGMQYVPWYLTQMQNYEQQHALRILDYLDLHYYPSASAVSLSPAGNLATQAMRLRSTRSLWDAGYIDESWISDTATGGVAVQLIPRMKQWVADNYPGTKLAISEYNWGAPESINGALAQADVLGIFGREGLDLATYWGDVVATQPWTFAFRMYRNYDGLGSSFGDTAVRSLSADQGALAVYAAQRSSDGALTIMLVNKATTPLTSAINLTGFNPQSTAGVYQYSAANLAAIGHVADQAVTASGLTATVPASSITLFEVRAAGQAISLSPTALNFAAQVVGTTSATQTVTLTNTSGSVLNIASIVANGDFAKTTTCGATLAQAASCAISVTFTPTIAGSELGSLVITSNAGSSPNTVSLGGTGTSTTSPPVCSLTANPTTIFAGGSSTLIVSCTPAATAFVWTGGTCFGNVTNSCTVTPTANTAYTVQASNASGVGNGVSATVTVAASPPVYSGGLYEGVYQWSPGYFLTIQQHGTVVIATMYFTADGSYSFNSPDGRVLTVPQLDLFDLYHGTITGAKATMTGTEFHRACNVGYEFAFSDSGNITVTKTAVSNTAAATQAGISCSAITMPLGTVKVVPKILF
jgi:hypothetical protein